MSQLTTNAATFSAPDLLAELDRRGITLFADGDKLRFDAPRGSVTDLLPEMRRLKMEILPLVEFQQRAPFNHRWAEATPDVAALGRALDGARRGDWFSPTPELLEIWKSLESYHGRKIASAELLAMASGNGPKPKAPKLPPVVDAELDRVKALLRALNEQLGDRAPLAIARAVSALKSRAGANADTRSFYEKLSPEDRFSLALHRALLDNGVDPGEIAP